ncbi:hypothetical protein EDB81DRAFT_295166 [Dactylonectria macrodidyma]|uniref:Retrovirus-related Pol polyprotein from transposon TNT 1-94-like beta-barrel domain-containing protein n=1 Tax=Dactylonectria macrodidyma TaxID=307937 RepID=A0A9P9D8Q9_9HYPO|nr:hypothetical protein EDB81DRAFT_295166 [Dactylonectria macrodidyma]
MASSRREEQASLPCPAWVWSSGSNIHLAKDRSWFGDDYTPFDSFIKNTAVSETTVVGIGTVNLPTKISPNKTGPRSHGTLRLKNVLHAPGIICNIIGRPILNDYNVVTRGTSGTITNLSDSRPVAYFKPETEGVRLFEVRLSGPPVGPKVGPSPFDPSTTYFIRASWPDSERERFAALQASRSRQSRAAANVPLAPSEKAWLKKHFESEFKFLQVHGLSIYKEEDREEGRTILRAIMSNGEDEAPSDDEFDDFDPEAHFADHHFSLAELDWINSGYGNSRDFMACFGLKFFNEEDCDEARAIARAMVAEDEDDDDDSDASFGVDEAARTFLLSRTVGSGMSHEDGERDSGYLQSRMADKGFD